MFYFILLNVVKLFNVCICYDNCNKEMMLMYVIVFWYFFKENFIRMI